MTFIAYTTYTLPPVDIDYHALGDAIRSYFNEEDLSTQQGEKEQEIWLSCPYEDPGRSFHPCQKKKKGQKETFCRR